MFELSNLNDYEFELLCKDIMEVKLGCSLLTFPKGRDHGIDICDVKANPKLIIQVKHYINSKYGDLKHSLNIEIPKVIKLAPKNYYICSSLKLSLKQKNEIYSLFSNYMKDLSHIIDNIEINDFLSEQDNIEIVNKHYKLWLCSSSVLSLLNNKNIFIDCDELICDIEKETPLFVQTKSYFQAKKKLHESGVIIIVGAPGVGKSTISKMLLLHYANEGFIVRYTSDNDISDIKNILSNNPNKKEIILLDDFLGQNYLKIKDSQPNELKTLISFIVKNPNKKLILNSRITIINEATNAFLNFEILMKENKDNEYLIDLDKMTNLEKAKILYNHIYFNYLPTEYASQVKKNRNYFKIIKHNNYNPRIIEFITMKYNYLKILPENYIEYVISKLDNPEDVWRDEFRNRLGESDRVLVNTLYSLTNTSVDTSTLEKSYNKRIRSEIFYDSSINMYKNTLNRLTNSLIKITEERGVIKISVMNPSINDYINAEIKANENEQIKIIKTSKYIEQMIKVAKLEDSKQTLMDLLFSGELLKMECLKNSTFYYYIKLIVEQEIYKEKIKQNFKISLEHIYEYVSDFDDYSDIITKILSRKVIQYYEIQEILLNEYIMNNIIKIIKYNKLDKIIDLYADEFRNCDKEEYANIMEIFHNFVIAKLSVVAQEKAEENMYQIISDNIDKFIGEFDEIDNDTLIEATMRKSEEDMKNYIENELYLYDKDVEIDISSFEIEKLVEEIDYSDAVNTVKNERTTKYEDEEYESPWKTEHEEIAYIFER